jgi:hypothetical protein
MNKKNIHNLKKFFALASIYLIISLTFITAHAMAVLDYTISGEDDISGFANRNGDLIKIDVTADSNVSFITGQNTAYYSELPLDGCVLNNVTNLVHCFYPFEPTDINTNIENISFVLKQENGVPVTKSGNLLIDGMAPQENYFTVGKDGSGLYFNYSFKDYLNSVSENISIGSGIGRIEITVQGRTVFSQDITTENCTVSGTFFKNFSNNYNDKIVYAAIVRDRVGNEYETGPREISGDFRPPSIASTFKIIRGGQELTTLSSSGQIQADVVIEIRDFNLSLDGVYGDLSVVNINPAVNIPYKNIQASCVKESSDLFICTFGNLSLRPNTADLSITITAKDEDGNSATKTSKKIITLTDNAGSVLFIGPSKNHCTADLTQCYSQHGRQILEAELDSSSSYNHSLIYFGIGDDRNFAICKLNNTWNCKSVYNIPNDISSFNMLIAESYDDYGNMLESNVQRTVLVDDTDPKNVSDITSTNSNNNMNCSVAGDELTLKLRVEESTPELKIYVDTTGFTSYNQQKGTCTLLSDGLYDCELIVKGFSSASSNNPRNITLEDLAGNKQPVNYTFEVCQSVSNKVPNVIYKVTANSGDINIDRRTASKIGVKAYIPIEFEIQSGASLMYLNIERCVAYGISGLDIMGKENYFIPTYATATSGTKATTMLVLEIGNNGAVLPPETLDINCTLSARVKLARTVFTQDERETFMMTVKTSENPLGTVDDNTNQAINVVKKRLRDIDKDLEKVEGINKILKRSCQFAEGLGKVNSIMQTIRAIIYPIALVIYLAGYTSSAGSTLWKSVQGSIGKFHKFVTQWVWPPGIYPGKSGFSFGSVIKYTCMLYTCKHYDVGTWTGLVTEIVATTAGKYTELSRTETSSEINSINPKDKDVSFSISANDGSDVNIRIKTKSTAIKVGDDLAYYESKTTTTIDTTKVVSFDQMDPTTPEGIRAREALHARGESLTTALNGHQWIINPYKSVHYDGSCLPAIIYNLKKEKQISCMYIACMNAQATTGIPKIMCDGDYKLNKCLYLDSAEYVLQGDGKIFGTFMRGLGEALANSGLGLAISTMYLIGCKKDLIPTPDIPSYSLSQPAAWRSTICGVVGAYFGVQEIIASIRNPFYEMITMDPAEDQDYCQDLDYSEASDVVITEGTMGGGYSDS